MNEWFVRFQYINNSRERHYKTKFLLKFLLSTESGLPCVCFRSRRRCDWCGCAGRRAVTESLSPEPKAVRWIRHSDSVSMFNAQETLRFIFSPLYLLFFILPTARQQDCDGRLLLSNNRFAVVGLAFNSAAVKLWSCDAKRLQQKSKVKKHTWPCLVKNNAWPFLKTMNSSSYFLM